MDWSFRTISFTKQPESRLPALPSELRDLIFEYALVCNKPLVTFRLDNYQKDSMSEAVQPALTRTNRQIRKETLPIWYGCNRFVLHTQDPHAGKGLVWLERNSRYMSLLKHIALWIRYVSPINDRGYGALSISMRRQAGTDVWYAEDDWEWITVIRKPTGLEDDARFLQKELDYLLENDYQGQLDAEKFHCILLETRRRYIEHKMS
ncbi:hypothetical protein LTR78_007766 [Recurvomyces mirabilis]|uniref:Uncharacterized protein n=1 Tax=Recurvomyces mirabilis TaxID=574656 RepID=A0AAE0TRI8_9PEZI|nr:hypothetical protein LTR78_007766 [Recurvomyces mirabilis]KAK5151654.1 hypothetical protein LTS14_009141 [Recurvomyces mirabilis]